MWRPHLEVHHENQVLNRGDMGKWYCNILHMNMHIDLRERERCIYIYISLIDIDGSNKLHVKWCKWMSQLYYCTSYTNHRDKANALQLQSNTMRQVTQWLHFNPMPTKYLAATHRGHQHVKVMPTPCIFLECFTTHSSNLRKCLYQIRSHARPHVNLCPLVNFSVWKLEALKFHGPKVAHCSASRSNRDIRKALRPRQLRAWPDDMPQRQQN